MNIPSWTAVLLVTGTISLPVNAQQLPQDNTQRKQPLTYWGIQFEELEYRENSDGQAAGVWDAELQYGTDDWTVRWLTHGEYSDREGVFESLENELVWQTPVSRYFDVKGGLRIDRPHGVDREYAVLGLAGLAPQWFEVDASLYWGGSDHALAELDAEYDWLLTNYWKVSASLDVTVALREDRAAGFGSGLATTETGLRISHDLIDRTFSPYAGIVYERRHGETANLAESAGESQDEWYAVFGARLLF